MCKVIAIANQKGGVGKTTTAASIGIGLAMSVRAAETFAEGVSIFSHDPAGKVAAAYEQIAKEVLCYA